MIAFRTMLPRDRAFVVSAWSSSLRKSDYAGMIHDDTWASVMHPQIERLIDRYEMVTTLAYSPDAEPGVADLFGFITADTSRPRPLVCFVYTKQPYRRSGVARKLFQAAKIDPSLPFDFACRTVFVDELARKIPRATFAPHLVRAAKEKQRA